ncbi:endonuclease Q family protein [Alkalihalobacterium elongatum]|uniref:endonuclease Q family protein n=1 Tax=Alkalihalobacterium elongatum TaxID=2675466 RepID=UPI002E282567|nr:endonuclease Q family protein [Alkalihalobacterium elongatum]
MKQLPEYFVDLHIHIGRTNSGKPVKITASKSLTLMNIVDYSQRIKGLNIIGIIDSHSPEVIEELKECLQRSEAEEVSGGGILFRNGITLLLGSELEIYPENCAGPFHILTYFPTIKAMQSFSDWLSERVTNINLSTQRVYEKSDVIQLKVKELNGLFIPAHAFTPHKGVYGKGVQESLTEVFRLSDIDGIELGLSSDTNLVNGISELAHISFISNSDAHSLEKIGREYQLIKMEQPSFEEFALALHKKKGRHIIKNFGLNPRLGKYYHTSCEICFTHVGEHTVCPHCLSKKITKGVFERLQELSDPNHKKVERPPYVHQIPLEFIPKLGPKTLTKLRDHFGNEMNIIHQASFSQLKEVVNEPIAKAIVLSRTGELSIIAGGAGKYGKVE